MIWDDTGFLLSKNRYNENSLISEVYTKEHGKVSGIIFGGTSKKIKNYLQIGNKIYVNFNSKSENRIGYFKVEIQEPLSAFYFDNYQKLSCIKSAMHLIKILTAEFQSNKYIYELIENFYILLKNQNWIKQYIFWELELFKILGYDSEKKIITNFLIDKNENSVDLITLQKALNLVGDYLEKIILKPNNLNHPISRLQFINTLR